MSEMPGDEGYFLVGPCTFLSSLQLAASTFFEFLFILAKVAPV